MTIKNQIGKRLKNLRVKDKYVQAKLAERFMQYLSDDGLFTDGKGITFENEGDGGIRYDMISDFERGERLSPAVVLAYLEVFDVSADYIFGKIDSYHPQDKSVRELTGLTNGAIQSLRIMNTFNDKDNILKRLRLSGASERNLEKLYQRIQNELKDQHLEDICFLVSFALKKKDFWIFYNEVINNIFKIQKESSNNTDNINSEKAKIIKRFEELLNDSIENFKSYNKRQKKLF